MYQENPEGNQVIVGSMNMGYISDIARNRTHNLFRPKRESIPLGHSDGHLNNVNSVHFKIWFYHVFIDFNFFPLDISCSEFSTNPVLNFRLSLHSA